MIRRLLSAWDSFWFTPASPVPMAVFRILIGLATLELLFFQIAPEFFTWFGTSCVANIDTVRAVRGGSVLDLYMLLPQGNIWWELAFALLVLSAIALTVGLFTRLSAAVVFMGLVSLFHHDPLVLEGPERLLFLAVLFILMSNAGRALSIDSLLSSLGADWRQQGFAPPLCSQWALRLAQLELSILYLQCVYSKLLGADWRAGTAVYYTSRIESLCRFEVPYVFDHLWTIKLITLGTIGIEAALAVLLWWRPVRYWVMVLGILLHAGIDITMSIPTFGWVTVFLYITFVDVQDLRKFGTWMIQPLSNRLSVPARLLFNGTSLDSVKLAGLIKRLDVLSCLTLSDQARELSKDGKPILTGGAIALETAAEQKTGYEALKWLALRLPLLSILLPLLMVPGSKRIVVALLPVCGGIFRICCRYQSGATVNGIQAAQVVKAAACAGIIAMVGLSATAWMRPLEGYTSHAQRLRDSELQSLELLRATGLPDPWSLPSPDSAIVPARSLSEQQRAELADSLLTRSRAIALRPASFPHASPVDAISREVSELQLRVLSQLASINWQNGEFGKAELLYRYIWQQRCRKRPFDAQLLQTMRELGGLYRDWSAFAAAAACYKAAIDYGYLHGENASLEPAKDLANLALVEYLTGCDIEDSAARQQRFDRANAQYGQALDECARHPGASSAITAAIMANRGILFIEREHERAIGQQRMLAGSSAFPHP